MSEQTSNTKKPAAQIMAGNEFFVTIELADGTIAEGVMDTEYGLLLAQDDDEDEAQDEGEVAT